MSITQEDLGIVTCHDGVSIVFKANSGATVMVDDYTKMPMSIMGHQADVDQNKNKFYALQAVTYMEGGKKIYRVASAYGRVGGRPTVDYMYTGDSEDAAARAFRDKAKDKFAGLKQSRAMSVMDTVLSQRADEEAGRFLTDTRSLYKVDFMQVIGSGGPGAGAPNAGPSGGAKAAVLPEVEKLLLFLTSASNIARASAQAALAHNVEISGKVAPMLSTVRAAKLEYAKASAILDSVQLGTGAQPIPPAAEYALKQHYAGILKLVAMKISSSSAYARAGNAVFSVSDWARIGKVLDLMEEAAVSASVAAPLTTANSTPVAPQPTDALAVASQYFGLYRTCQDNGVFGAWLRPAPGSQDIKKSIAQQTKAQADEVYANLRCDLVPGNAGDQALCWEFLKESRDTQEYGRLNPGSAPFECYAIHPYSNDAKTAIFSGRDAVLLVHGTSMSSVAAILNGEMDIKYCSGGRLGARRLYMADSILKSQNYAPKEQGYAARSVRFYFICECLLPASEKKILRTTAELGWKSVHPDPETLVVATGTRSRGAVDPECCRDAAAYAGAPAYPERGYFGPGERAVRLPAEKEIYPRGSVESEFDFAEYVFGSNDQVQPRYLVVQYLP